MKRNWLPILLGIIATWVIVAEIIKSARKTKEEEQSFASFVATEEHDSAWIAPSLFTDNETSGEERKKVMYGQDLIAHTAKYYGPKRQSRTYYKRHELPKLSSRCRHQAVGK